MNIRKLRLFLYLAHPPHRMGNRKKTAGSPRLRILHCRMGGSERACQSARSIFAAAWCRKDQQADRLHDFTAHRRNDSQVVPFRWARPSLPRQAAQR
jgi:hypothetical protein